jgi:hypothetical protein
MRRRKKRGWLVLIGLSVVTVLAIWSLAFLLWLFWPDLKELLPPTLRGTGAPLDRGRAGEQIRDGERKDLEEILKQKQ